MRKLILAFLAVMLLSIAVFAQGPKGIHEPGTGIAEPELYEAGQGSGQGQQAQQQEMEQEQLQQQASQGQGAGQGAMAQVRESVQQRQQQMEQEMQQQMAGKSEKVQNMYRNQNQVRLAVHALLEMKEELGGIGQQVSELAQGFDNSVQATLRAEEKIQTRGGFKRFFAGGDAEAADELDTEVNQNMQRIQEMKQLHADCDCGEEAKAMLQEQIQSMEQEQNRLRDLAQKEKKSKGMLGWIWK